MRAKRSKEKVKMKDNKLLKIITVVLFLIITAIVINIAPNYIRDKQSGINLIINNSNITKRLKHEIKVDENEVVYVSFEDIKNFFDGDIYYDKQYNQIITTSETKVATIKTDKREMYVNGSKANIYATILNEDETYYLPISEMNNVYNIEVKYSEDSKIVTIDSLDKEQKMGNSSKDATVKYKPTIFSKSVDKVKKGESVIVISEEDGWYKVRTSKGNIGYLKDVANIYSAREEMTKTSQIEGKVSLVWDYFTNSAPQRTENIKGINVVSPSFASLKDEGQGEIVTKIGSSGINYINWAHNNGYKIWAMVQNEGFKDTTSEILNDYKLREKLINNILDLANTYNLDGINIDFEYMYEADKDMFSQFIIELAPRLKELGKVLSVDVTAPDGSANWSLCYNRNKIAQVADYIVFMGYDQYGFSSTTAGTTAGADWVEVNIKKFIDREEVDKEKLILAMPFYTRLWKETGDKATSTVIYMKNINSKIPAGVQKTWNDDLKQYYIEYNDNGVTYKMWIEDENSLKEKFALMKKYELAGAAYWQKDFEPSSLWNVISNELSE